MSTNDCNEGVDMPSLKTHLTEALDRAENDMTKYHLREAYQKVVILKEAD